MGRPPGFDRDEAVKTAMQEIWRSGYEASSVKAISEKLGITRSSFYNAFGSREDLFKEVMCAYFEQSPDHALRGDLPVGPITGLIVSTFREVCRVRAADPDGRGCMVINCLCELKGGPNDEIGELVAGAVLASRARLEELLLLAIERGELPEGSDTHAMSLALQTLLIGLNAMSKAVRSEDDLWLTARVTLTALGLTPQ